MTVTERQANIRTPDQRLRVFVSSTLAELADERVAARAAVEQVRLTPVMFELGARPHPPRALYRAYLEQSDIFVGIYWQRYGWVAPDMEISGLEDEFLLSTHMPRLIYIKQPAPEREARLDAMLAGLEGEGSVSYKSFSTTDELHRLVADDLAVMLTERFVLSSDPERTRSVSTAVPQATTRLVGREGDLASIEKLLAEEGRRLVTLTGTGGIGKTRLALAVLERLRPSWPDGAVFVDLSPVRDPDVVLAVVAAACGTRPEGNESMLEALVRWIDSAKMLVVLDNFEQVTDAATDVAALLQRCPNLSILVTSRILLRVRGESEFPVKPLELPSTTTTLVQLERTPAVDLFVDRARDIRPSFELNSENAQDVSELCRHLDGVPLALELAAARTRLMTPRQVLDRLDQHLSAGTFADLPERQRTLTATLDWSYELLDGSSQVLFARLSALSGPFTLEAAEAVGGWGDVDAFEALSTLLDHSLVSFAERPDGEPAFRFLETVRTYARAKLEASDELEVTYERLADYVIGVLADAGPRMFSSEQYRVVAILDSEAANVLETLGFVLSTGRSPGRLLELMTELWLYWSMRGHLRSMPDPAEWIKSSPAASVMTERDWCAVYFLQGGRLFTQARYEDVVRIVPDRIRLMESLGMRTSVAMMTLITAASRPYSPDSPARSEIERMLALLDEDDYRRGYGLAHYGPILLNHGDLQGSAAASEKSLRIAQDRGDLNLIAESHFQLAHVAVASGDLDSARAHVQAAVDIYRELDYLEGKAYCLACGAGIAVTQGDAASAARLLGAAAALREPIELRPWPATGEIERRYEQKTKDALSQEEFSEHYEAGKQMASDDALELTRG